MLNDIKIGRSTFDNNQTEKCFGPIIVDYRMVQTKINNKYDQWHKELLGNFGNNIQDKMRVFYKVITNERNKLQKVIFNATGSEVIENIQLIYSIDKKYITWNQEIDSFRSGGKLLDRQRFNYPSDWLSIEQIEQEWSNLK